jgi:uncharacterized protein (TIGR03000 family)
MVPARLLLAAVAFLAAAVPAHAGGPIFRGGSGWGLGFFGPSAYGYNLWETNPGYYGGGSYREYYSYGRGYGLANFPGPLPGPMYRPDTSGILPPKRLPPAYPPPEPASTLATSSGRAAYLVVETPLQADVWLEGVKSKQTGTTRLFVSPPLTPGQYAYEVRARWTEDGREVEQKQEVTVQPGDRRTVRFPTEAGPLLEDAPPPKRFPLERE